MIEPAVGASSRRRGAVRVVILLAIVVLAAGLRLYRLADLPPGLFIDQAQYGLDAWRIAEGERFPVFVEGPGGNKERGREPMFMYLMAGIFLLLGPSPVTIKLTSALIGIATVLVTYFAAARFLGERTGLCAAALIAVSRWHITFSRMGFRAVLAPFMVAAVVLALGWLIARRSRGSAVLFGVVVGAGFYTYPAFWSVPPALALVGLVALWERRASLRRTIHSVRPLAIAAATACLLTVVPLGVYAATHADDLFGRAREVTLVGGAGAGSEEKPTVLDGVQRVLFMLHLRGDVEPRHNIPLRPMLDRLTGLLFLAGLLAIAKAKWSRALETGLIVLWLLPLAPSAVTWTAPHALRAVAAIPAVCVIAAVGLDAVARQIERLRVTRFVGDRLATVAATAAIAIALGTAAVVNARDYFVVWGSLPVLPSTFSGDIPRFVEYLDDLGGDADVVSCPYVFSSPNIRFLTLRAERQMQPLDGVDALLASPETTRDRVFVCDEPATNALIHRVYPGAEEIGRYSIYTQRTGRVIRVPREQLWTRLPPGEEEQARYFIDRMNAAFAARADEW